MTDQPSVGHYGDSLRMSDNMRDLGKDEDPSFQTSSGEDN
jgi:hypothetical protein